MANAALDLEAIEARYKAAGGGPWWKERDIRNVRATVWTEDIPVLMAEVKRLRRELHDEQVRRDEWEKMYNQAIAGTEVEWLYERVRQVNTSLGHEVDSRVRAELEVEQLQAELAQTHQDAQNQSDEVQELWLSPCEAEGLKRQLAKAESLAALRKALLDEEASIADDYLQKFRIEQRLRIEMGQHATHAESLATLMTPELAELLDRLAGITRGTGYSGAGVAASAARVLAARIREALEEHNGAG